MIPNLYYLPLRSTYFVGNQRVVHLNFKIIKYLVQKIFDSKFTWALSKLCRRK